MTVKSYSPEDLVMLDFCKPREPSQWQWCLKGLCCVCRVKVTLRMSQVVWNTSFGTSGGLACPLLSRLRSWKYLPLCSCTEDCCSLQTFTLCLSEVNYEYTLLCKMLMRQSWNWEGLLKQICQITVMFCSFTESTFASLLKCCSSSIACSLEKSPANKPCCFMPLKVQGWCQGAGDKSKPVSCYWKRYHKCGKKRVRAQ